VVATGSEKVPIPFWELQNYMLLYTSVVPKDGSRGTALPSYVAWHGILISYNVLTRIIEKHNK
jgi:hypothetical protein